MGVMKAGYARVSRQDQNPDLQRRELEEAGCERIFEEKFSGSEGDRPVLREALDYVREGAVLVVWRLDRLGRSLKELIELVNGVEERGVEFGSLRESLDTGMFGPDHHCLRLESPSGASLRVEVPADFGGRIGG